MKLIQTIITGILPLLGVWLGSFLSKRQAKYQFLIETRRTVFSRLLSSVISEENYPREIAGTTAAYDEKKVEEYNNQVNEWRRNRKLLKGLASEALLVTENVIFQNKLSEFVSSHNPDTRLSGLEELMRKEIEI